MKNVVKAYRNSNNELCFRGMKLSEMELKSGYISYDTLRKVLGSLILNDELINIDTCGEWILINGRDYDFDENEAVEICQYYIIDQCAAEYLIERSNEIVYYNKMMNVYIWGVDHWGTDWKYVDTDIKFQEDE